MAWGDGAADSSAFTRVVPPVPPHTDPVSGHPSWVEADPEDFDLYHLHLGAQQVSPARLRRLVANLEERGRPLVVTLHELRGLRRFGPGAFEEALEVVVPAAARLITLTPGAAVQIRERWGREAEVIPHPHVLPLDQLGRPRPDRRRPTVTVPLEDLSAQIDPLPMLEILEAATAHRGMDLHISVVEDALEPFGVGEARGVTAALTQLARSPHVRIDAHRPETEVAGWERLRGADLCVLPHRFGTHCRMIEACHDVGTRVLAPDLGYYRQQRPGVLTHRRDDDGAPYADDVESVLDHVSDELAAGTVWQAGRLHRTAQRQRIAHLHEQLYRAVL